MKTKRIFAILMALIMVLALVPAGIFAEEAEAIEPDQVIDEKIIDGEVPDEVLPESEKDVPEKGNMDAQVTVREGANDKSTYLVYTSYDYFTGKEGSGYNYVETTNVGQHNTTAKLVADEFYMQNGTKLDFDYWFETEQGYDKFYFLYTKDDSETVVLNGLSGYSGGGTSGAWVHHTFTAPSSGNYKFTWKYTKDGSNSTGADCVRICQIKFSVHYNQYRYRACLSNTYTGAVSEISFTGGTHEFLPVATDNTAHPLYLWSGNKGESSSTAKMTMYFYVPEAFTGSPEMTFKFDYAYESEANYDKFIFKLDGETVFEKSGTGNYTWTNFTTTVEGSGIHTAVWIYQKDGSTNTGNDCVCIDNIRMWTCNDGYDRAVFYYDYLNSANTSANLTFNTPNGYESFVPCSNYNGSDPYVLNDNRYQPDSDAAIETRVNMDEGEKLSFQYKVSSETSVDQLRFYVNGSLVASFSGWNDYSWHTYTYTATELRNYSFRWVYHKDSTIDRGYDCAYIDTVTYYGTTHSQFNLDQALNSLSTDEQLAFYTPNVIGVDSFEPVYNSSTHYAVSRNKYFESSTAYLETSYVWLNPGDTFYFQYRVASGSSDKLTFFWYGQKDGSVVFDGEGSSSNWKGYTFTCEEAGSYGFSWEFTKDGSVNEALDIACLATVRVKHQPVPTIDEVMNEVFHDDFHFETGVNYEEFVPFCVGTDWVCAAASGGGNGIGATNAYMTTAKFMRAGEKFDFYYKSHLLTGSSLVIEVNGEVEFELDSGDSNDDERWHKFAYTAFTAGRHELKITYERPAYSYDVNPSDYVYIDSIDLFGTPTATVSIDEALNFDGGTLHFENVSGKTPWISDWWYDDHIATSGNCMETSTDSAIKTTVYMSAGDKLTFQYFVDSEGHQTYLYDYFSFMVNGNTIFTQNGDFGWEWYTWTATTAGTYTFTWNYHKDSSNDKGLDCAKLDFVQVIPNGDEPTGMLGDVNGDGTINTEDALIALRYALGITSSIPDDWFYRGDVDGNGVIDTTDALLILRYALGIISSFPAGK